MATTAGVAAASSTEPEGSSGAASVEDYLDANEALRLDAQQLAKQTGRSTEEVLRELELAPRVQDMIEDAKQRAGDRFAGAWVEHKPEWQLHIAVTTGEPVSLGSLARSAEVPVVVEYREGPSEKELVEEANRLAVWATATPGVDGVEANTQGPELIVYTNNESPSSVQRTAPPRVSGVDVRFVSSGEPARDTYTLRGGAGGRTCTVGFTATAGPSSHGYVTAGHCNNTQTWSPDIGTYVGTMSPSTFGGELRNANADLQYHTITNPHVTSNTFFGGSDITPTIRNGTGTAFVGQGLCHRGMVTSSSCGNVTSTTFAPTWENACNGTPCNAVFVRADGVTLGTSDGDSGGPWFSGAAAYGIHKGGNAGWTVYTPISQIAFLGLTLM
ncbi:hypothetical protein [Cellulosimicrobium sp. NPDC057862]|uniref:hypothetical protein n=1 Tax=Cellulosimicrobium sp. NPDC057862 TaxID=3346266 RepID=UPI00366C63A3